jgi:hypothetical protein
VPLSEYEGILAAEPDGLKNLYRTVAGILGSDIPAIDFTELSKEVAAFETEYTKERAAADAKSGTSDTPEKILNPKALCISSAQFSKLGFENQLEVVLNAFPAVVPHQRVFSSAELRKAVSNDRRFDIVHIAAFVCPRTGTLYFSDVDLNTGASTVAEPDFLSADALASLLKVAEAKLVVIGSCDSMALGMTLVSVCDVIAARDMVSPKMMAAWVEVFYGKLADHSLSQALDYALNISQAPMRFYGRQIKKDMIFIRPRQQAVTV